MVTVLKGLDSPLWVYILGLLGMAIYGSRIVVQWYISEKHKRVESPGIYWVMSSIGAIMLYVYGYLRKDFSIIFGESLSYYIYMWNISVLGMYKKVPKFVIVLQALIPVAIIVLIARDWSAFVADFFPDSEEMSDKLLLFGMLGQFTFEIRSVYQLVYSMRRKTSVLPLGHWLLAVAGGIMIIIYGFIRHDWVLVIGQFSIFFSIRNIMLYFISRRNDRMKNCLSESPDKPEQEE